MSDLLNRTDQIIEYDHPSKTSTQKKLDAIIYLFGSQEFTKSEYLEIAAGEKVDVFIAELYLKQLTKNAKLRQLHYDKYRNPSFL